MVNKPTTHHRSQRGIVAADLAIALGIIALVIAPLTHSWLKEQQVMSGLYKRSIAMQIVDGEAEILAAGEWIELPTGSHPYAVTGAAAKNLPEGKFIATRTTDSIKLEWVPTKRGYGGPVVRLIKLPTAKGSDQ